MAGLREIELTQNYIGQEDGEPDPEPHEQHRAEDGTAAREDDVARHGQPAPVDHEGPQGDLRQPGQGARREHRGQVREGRRTGRSELFSSVMFAYGNRTDILLHTCINATFNTEKTSNPEMQYSCSSPSLLERRIIGNRLKYVQ